MTSIIVIPPSGGVSSHIQTEQPPRRRSSFSGEFLEYTETLSNLYEKTSIANATIKIITPSTLELAKKVLADGNQSMSLFSHQLEKMRVTENSLSSDPTKTGLAQHFQIQLRSLILSTEERLTEYSQALSALDRHILTNQLDDTKELPPLQRQTRLPPLASPTTTWQKCCVIL